LTVICGRRDLPRVQRLNADGRAEVFCELSRSEHDERVRASALYVLCLKDSGPSAGHVRLMAVVDCGTPVIATAVRGLEGYVEDGRSAILVPPGDPERLGDAIDRLLDDPERRRALRETAAELARAWTYRDFFGAIRTVLLSEIADEA
jgi:glycosyltransferase involved in cell wall biosynthesis